MMPANERTNETSLTQQLLTTDFARQVYPPLPVVVVCRLFFISLVPRVLDAALTLERKKKVHCAPRLDDDDGNLQLTRGMIAFSNMAITIERKSWKMFYENDRRRRRICQLLVTTRGNVLAQVDGLVYMMMTAAPMQ